MVSTRSSSSTLTPGLPPTTPHRSSRAVTPVSSTSSTSPSPSGWSHAPTTLTLIWLAVSLPLVIWDTGYVLGRPHTMPGGWAHWPIWAPYALYGEVDHIYGFKQWNAGNGFTAAQGWLNAVETAMYLAYFWIWYSSARGVRGGEKRIAGRAGAFAVVLGFAASVMTVSKTVLYWLNEYHSSFDNIGHNKPLDLLLLWIIPNGAWLVVPTYMIYQIGSEIIDGLTLASAAPRSIKSE